MESSDSWYAEIQALKILSQDGHPRLQIFDWGGMISGPETETRERLKQWNTQVDEAFRTYFGSELGGRDWLAVLSKLSAMGLVSSNRGLFGAIGWNLTEVGWQVVRYLLHGPDPDQSYPAPTPGWARTPAVLQLRVYIAHSHKDNPVSTPLEARLRQRGFETWYDLNDINYGNSLIDKMNYGLEHCDAFLLIWSEHAKASKWVKDETAAAMVLLNEGKIRGLLTVILDTTPLPPLLAPKKYRHHDPEEDQELFANELAGALRSLS